MSLQTLLISALITCVTVGVTFFYFRNRIQRTEQKVDLMFSLIQEHENNAKLRQQMPPIAMQGGMSSAALGQSQQHMPSQSQNELINISDDVDQNDPNGDNWYYEPGGDASKINGTESNGTGSRIQEGGKYPDTEDLDRSTFLDKTNDYFSASFMLSDTTYLAGITKKNRGTRQK